MNTRRLAPLAFLLAVCSCGTGRPAQAVVVGTAVDAATGEALSGATIEGPHGASAVSGSGGSFEIRGLSPGDAGEVVARLPDGREGKVSLRPLKPGKLEVVIHLSRP